MERKKEKKFHMNQWRRFQNENCLLLAPLRVTNRKHSKRMKKMATVYNKTSSSTTNERQKNDTILNYYYFQMTKHDVTNRLPASQTPEKTLKKKISLKHGVEWSDGGSSKKKLWKVCLSLFLFLLRLISSSASSVECYNKLKFLITMMIPLFSIFSNSFGILRTFLCKSRRWRLNCCEHFFFVAGDCFNATSFIIRNCVVASVVKYRWRASG